MQALHSCQFLVPFFCSSNAYSHTYLKDPLLLGRLLGVFYGFHRLFRWNAALLFPTLNRMLSLVVFVGPTESAVIGDGWFAHEDTIAVRRKACSTLLRLAVDFTPGLTVFDFLLEKQERNS